MRIRLSVPDSAVTPELLEHVAEASTLANQHLISRGLAPTATDLIQRGGRWKPTNHPDGQHFDLLPQIGERGTADCKSWAPALAGELRASGDDTGARVVIRRTGDRRWHALTQLSNGELVDPSRWAGMPSRELPLARRPLMQPGISGAIVVRRSAGVWGARCDLPMEIGHICGIGEGPTPAHALHRAALCLGPAHIDGPRVCGLIDQIGQELGADLAARRTGPTVLPLPDGGYFATQPGQPMMMVF